MPENDDTSNIPRSVLKQQREADKAIEGLNDPADDGKQVIDKDPAPEPAPVEEDPKPVNTDPKEPIKDDPAKPAITDVGDGSQWEHKYSVLQGKYNKEISSFRDKVAELELSLENQNKVVEDLTSKKPEQSPGQSDMPGDLNPDDFDGWGPEMKTMVETINRQNALIQDQASVIGDLKGGKMPGNDSNMNQRVESIEQEIGKTRGARYTEVLDTKIKGDWRQINTDQKFLEWANQVDPITMQPVMDHLRQAAQELRGDQVASIFNRYIEVSGIEPTARKSFVDSLPAGGGGGEQNLSVGGKPTLTASDIAKAQVDHIQGKITEEEYDTIYKQFQKELRSQRK